MTATDPHPGRRRRRIVLAAVLAFVVVFSGATARLFIWPDLPPLPDRADAIVELGGQGDRDSVALALARAHKAPYLVQSTLGDDTHCLPPVPDVTILCFHAEPNTTRGEAESIAQLARQYHWHSVILVTTPDQAWRARVRVSRCIDGPVYVSTAKLPFQDWFWLIPYQWGASAKALFVETSC